MVLDICCHLRPHWPARWQLAALLHDAPEYVIGDMISPFKAVLGVGYAAFEERLTTAIHMRFGLPAALPVKIRDVIKRADKAAAFFEAVDIAGFSDEEAAEIFGRPRGLPHFHVHPLPTRKAQSLFLDRFHPLAAVETAGGHPARAAGR